MGLNTHQQFREESRGVPVKGFLHCAESGQDCLILTHGAGSNCAAPLLVLLAEAFCSAGITVLRCDLPFRQVRPQGPPPRGSGERDQQGLRAAIEAMRPKTAGRIFLGGHSYGGRQASMAAATDPALADGLLLLSYPLHPPQRPGEMRTGHFPDLITPTLFVHGTRDGFGSPSEMTAALRLIPGRNELLFLEGSGHELLPKRNHDAMAETLISGFRGFVDHQAAS